MTFPSLLTNLSRSEECSKPNLATMQHPTLKLAFLAQDPPRVTHILQIYSYNVTYIPPVCAHNPATISPMGIRTTFVVVDKETAMKRVHARTIRQPNSVRQNQHSRVCARDDVKFVFRGV